MPETKKRRITSADWDRVEKFVNGEHETRKTASFRKSAETLWKEVDRQLAMQPMKRRRADGKAIPNTWQSAIELGELAKAQEIIAADVMRIQFPQDRAWFQPHVKLEWPINPKTGAPQINSTKQKVADGLLRNLMVQQQKDFGFKSRYRLSVKEALSHGSFVAEIRWEKALLAQGDRVGMMAAPVWVPYSMWNSYPDPSPSVLGTNRFYTGNMILVEYMPMYKLKSIATGEGWIKGRLKDIPKKQNTNKDNETDDVELLKFYGDINIERGDGDVFLPNSKVILANGKLVFYDTVETKYPPIIFSGYERQDVRDPYYTSPIIKLSPMQKAASVTVNKFLDAMALKVEPPIEYDGNDPDYVENDGPMIAPGAKTPTKSMGHGMKALDVGDPQYALKGVEMFFMQIQQGLGVSSLRSGAQEADRQTATEANLLAQGAEVRTMEFLNQLESQALTPWLYMQHDLNRANISGYSFYNDELHTPDFMIAEKENVDVDAHFEVVGSRGVLGEEKRRQQLSQTTAFFLQNPITAQKINIDAVMQDMYRDAGKKNPEEYVRQEQQVNPQMVDQMKQMIQQLQQALQEAQNNTAVKEKELQLKTAEMAKEQQRKDEEFAREQARKDVELKAKVTNSSLDTVVNFRLKSAQMETDKLLKVMKASESEAEPEDDGEDSDLEELRKSQEEVLSAIKEIKRKMK